MVVVKPANKMVRAARMAALHKAGFLVHSIPILQQPASLLATQTTQAAATRTRLCSQPSYAIISLGLSDAHHCASSKSCSDSSLRENSQGHHSCHNVSTCGSLQPRQSRIISSKRI